MSNLKKNFANQESASAIYSLKCQNNSGKTWVFYMYQREPEQSSNTFSLAWFAKRVPPGATVIFEWTLDYSFAQQRTGRLMPGLVFTPEETVPCSPNGNNRTTFSVTDHIGHLSDPVPGGPAGTLSISVASNVSPGEYATGIGMSGGTTLIQQALPNMVQLYQAAPRYFLAFASQMQQGQVLDTAAIAQSASIVFPAGVYSIDASLDSSDQWHISPGT